jgi:hypothetical protein
MSLLERVDSGSIRQTGNRHRDGQGGRQPTRPVFSLPHFPHSCCSSPFFKSAFVQQLANLLRIRCDILLQIQIVEQLEISIQVVIRL